MKIIILIASTTQIKNERENWKRIPTTNFPQHSLNHWFLPSSLLSPTRQCCQCFIYQKLLSKVLDSKLLKDIKNTHYPDLTSAKSKYYYKQLIYQCKQQKKKTRAKKLQEQTSLYRPLTITFLAFFLLNANPSTLQIRRPHNPKPLLRNSKITGEKWKNS